MWRSKSFLVRLAQVSSAIRIISTIIPNSSAASCRDLTVLIVYIGRNTCLMCVLTCVESILVITFTLSTSVKFWEHKYTTRHQFQHACLCSQSVNAIVMIMTTQTTIMTIMTTMTWREWHLFNSRRQWMLGKLVEFLTCLQTHLTIIIIWLYNIIHCLFLRRITTCTKQVGFISEHLQIKCRWNSFFILDNQE